MTPTVPPAKKRYHVGLAQDCPYFTTSVGGVSLSQIMYVAVSGRDLPRLGEIHMLTEAQVTRFKDHLEKAVVRQIGSAPFRYDSDAPHYSAEEGDQPLKKWVFFRELGPNEEPGLATPETLLALERKAEALKAEADAAEEAAKHPPVETALMTETLPAHEAAETHKRAAHKHAGDHETHKRKH